MSGLTMTDNILQLLLYNPQQRSLILEIECFNFFAMSKFDFDRSRKMNVIDDCFDSIRQPFLMMRGFYQFTRHPPDLVNGDQNVPDAFFAYSPVPLVSRLQHLHEEFHRRQYLIDIVVKLLANEF